MKTLILKRNKWLWVLLLMTVLLIPTVLLANAILPTNNWVGMTGVSHSNLYIGLNGITHSNWWIGMNVQATYINPTSGVGSIINLFPLIFMALAVMVLIGYGLQKGFTPFTLIVMAIIIYVAIGLLMGINGNILSMFGGA